MNIRNILGWRRRTWPTLSRSRRDELADTPRHNRSDGRVITVRIVMLGLVWIVAAALFFVRPSQLLPPYVEGQIADRSIYSEIPFEYEDSQQTFQHREAAISLVPAALKINRVALDRALLRWSLLRQYLGETPGNSGQATLAVDRDEEFVTALPSWLTTLTVKQKNSLEYLVATSGKWRFLERLIKEVAGQGIIAAGDLETRFGGKVPEDLIHILDDFSRKRPGQFKELFNVSLAANRITAGYLQNYPENTAEEKDLLEKVLPWILLPNLDYDPMTAEKNRQQAAFNVPASKRVIQIGEPLLRRGQTISGDDLNLIQDYKKQREHLAVTGKEWRQALFHGIFFLLILICAGVGLHAIHPEAVNSRAMMVMLGTVIIMQMFLSQAVLFVFFHYWNTDPQVMPLILPLSFGAMLLGELVGLRVAIWAGMLTSLAVALEINQALVLFCIGSISSLVAAVLMRHARRRHHALRTGLGVGASIALLNVLFLWEANVPLRDMASLVVLAFAGSIPTAIFAAAITPLFEYLFGVTTDLNLLELSDLNHPLLKRLQMEAPGTYHHSLMVGHLAELAAASIGANPMLARVCAYFHDIGKLQNPDYYSENEMGHDPHRDLNPRMSTLVIMNHVKTGLTLAAQYKLKRPLREAIEQHHGTSLVYYFYRRALNKKGVKPVAESPVDEHQFRYPGPLPVRKEIVIVGIADACEAASRSLEKPTPGKIKAAVDGILLKRIQDSQFDEADLTFKELAVVKDTLVKALVTMLHRRVQYPQDSEVHSESDTDQSLPATDAAAAPADAGSASGRDPA